FEKIILVKQEKTTHECLEAAEKWLGEKKFKSVKKDAVFKLLCAYDDLTGVFDKARALRFYDDNSVVIVSKDGKNEEKIYFHNKKEIKNGQK
ncbi:MAG: hypothetical protein AAB851_02350, partial [Patescibacteria group bacterium]